MTARLPGPRHPAAADLRSRVRQQYARLAGAAGCCGGSGPSDRSRGGDGCCGGAPCPSPSGYRPAELAALPPGADLGLGCGHPSALADLRPGETVLDLGSGAGVDCFLAARRVGPSGRAIGVDMTPEMLARARENARHARVPNVEFRLGEIEHLPVADRSVDVVISNCVINLAPAKAPVYREAFRVLRPGGRIAIADVLARRPAAASERPDWASCVAGALSPRTTRRLLQRAGFHDVRIVLRRGPGSGRQGRAGRPPRVASAEIRARRPPSG